MKLTILKLIALCLAVTAGFITFTGRSHAGNSAQGPAAQTATAAPPEKTMGQTGKNIKVLNDLPESQLGTVMNYFAASLGVRCNFCHVNKGGNNWVWEADDKEEKLTARAMIKMTMAINKDNFRGNVEVGCNTCHRGQNHPQGIPSLPLPAPPPRPQGPAPGAPAATPSPTPAPPTADQILAKYIDALGGQAAIDKMKSRSMKGTYVGVTGTALNFEALLVAPDKFYINVTGQQGSMERVFNGTAAWQKTSGGTIVLDEPVLGDLKSVFSFFRNIKLKEQFTRLRPGRRDKIGDREMIVLNGTAADGHREQLFFDAETGLLRRRISFVTTMIGVIPEQIDFDDYRDVEDVKLPFSIRVLSVEPGLVSTRSLTEIKLNVPFDDSKFVMPAIPKPAKP